MSRFSEEQLRQRKYERVAWVIRHIWEELQDDPKRESKMHSRLFEVLIGDPVHFGKSIKGGGHTEHLVPCALLRDRAFQMYWEGKDINRDISAVEKDVAKMLEKFLAIADIHPTEAELLDYKLSLKTKMPKGWDWETGLVDARLIEAKIILDK